MNEQEKGQIWVPSLETVKDFFRTKVFAVVATVDEQSRPYAATIGFSSNEKNEIIFRAIDTTAKIKNIMQNGYVALTITDEKQLVTMQIQGTAKIYASEQADDFAPLHYAKLPFLASSHDEPGTVFAVVTPTAIKYTDIKTKPWTVVHLLG